MKSAAVRGLEGYEQIYVNDPFGNRLELLQYLK